MVVIHIIAYKNSIIIINQKNNKPYGRLWVPSFQPLSYPLIVEPISHPYLNSFQKSETKPPFSSSRSPLASCPNIPSLFSKFLCKMKSDSFSQFSPFLVNLFLPLGFPYTTLNLTL